MGQLFDRGGPVAGIIGGDDLGAGTDGKQLGESD